MGYENGKIYKLQVDDGRFYIGSCITRLSRRACTHRNRAKTQTSLMYSYIKDKQWRMVLIVDFPCKSKEELRREEDKYIQAEINNPLCLNQRNAILNVEKAKERGRKWYQDNKEMILKRMKEKWDAKRQ